METNNYITEFGKLCFSQKVEDEYFWEASYSWESTFYKQTLELPISVFSKEKTIPAEDISFLENIVFQMDTIIPIALTFFSKTLSETPKQYRLSTAEKSLLSLPLSQIPLECPQLIYYQEKQWGLHFLEGNFECCDPYGIMIHFQEFTPIQIENLENADAL